MKAIILAAGKGTRMRPLTETVPKPMLPLLGRPILEHIIESLPREVDELVIVIGYLGGQIRDHFGGEWHGRTVRYVEQVELSGHMPALNLAKPFLDTERFLMLFADDLHDAASIRSLLDYPRALLVAPVEHPERFGIVVASPDNKMIEFEEKPKAPKSNLAWTGVCLLDQHVFEYEPELHENGEYYLPPVIQKMIKDYDMFVVAENFWLPIGYPEDLKRAEAILSQGTSDL